MPDRDGRERNQLRGQDLVLIASAPWKSAGRVNCHHIATRLARSNRVLYVESSGLRAPRLSHGPDRRKVLTRLGNWARSLRAGPRQLEDSLWVASPLVFPLHGGRAAHALNRRVFGRAIAAAARQLGLEAPLLWSFLPTGIYARALLHECLTIYHCVDDYAGNPGVDASTIERLEREIVSAADFVLATSGPLAARMPAGKTHCVPNVAETERFAVPCQVPGDLDRIPRPRIGYVGNVASYKVDVSLLARVAAARRSWSIVLIGGCGGGDAATDIAALRQQPNVHLLGLRAYDEIPAYVQGLDVGLIPFRRSRVTDASLPLKTFEYLAAGLPVVSTPLAALRHEPLDDVIRYASGPTAFVDAIEQALATNGEGQQAALRREVAARYSWSVRFPAICEVVSRKLEEGRHRACGPTPKLCGPASDNDCLAE